MIDPDSVPKSVDHLKGLDSKFTVLCKVVFCLSFKLCSTSAVKEEGIEFVGSATSKGTSSNPIIEDEKDGLEPCFREDRNVSHLGGSSLGPS